MPVELTKDIHKCARKNMFLYLSFFSYFELFTNCIFLMMPIYNISINVGKCMLFLISSFSHETF